MKRRAQRAVIGAAALVAALVAVLVAANWGTVRDHVEGWHFQLMRDTKTIEPLAGMAGTRPYGYPIAEHLLHIVADELRCPVIFDPEEMPTLLMGSAKGNNLRDLLEKQGWRVLEQRFPRRAYVVIHDPRPVLALPIEEREPPGCPFPREERP